MLCTHSVLIFRLFIYLFEKQVEFGLVWRSICLRSGNDVTAVLTIHRIPLEIQYGRRQEYRYRTHSFVLYQCLTANLIKICP